MSGYDYGVRVRYQDCWEEGFKKFSSLDEARSYCECRIKGPLGQSAMYYVYGPFGDEIDCRTCSGWVSKDVELPIEYIPTSLRKPKPQARPEVLYGCGYEETPGSFGMFHGPNPNVEQMLEVVPDDSIKKPCLIRFNKNGTDEVLYRWHQDRWIRTKLR